MVVVGGWWWWLVVVCFLPVGVKRSESQKQSEKSNAMLDKDFNCLT